MALRTLFTLISAFFIFPSLFAQQIEWENSLGGSNLDRAHSIQQTSDRGYVVAGKSSSNDGDVWGNHGSGDLWVVKLNSSGDTNWTHCLGGSGTDVTESIQKTHDGGYIVGGGTRSKDGDVSGGHGKVDLLVVKLNNSGDTTWTRTLGGSGQDWANSIKQTNDDGFIVAGGSRSTDGDVSSDHRRSDIWVVKLNNSGDTVWTRPLGGSDAVGAASSIQQTSDGGYIVTTSLETNSPGDYDYWVAKLSSSGGIVWTRTLGGTKREQPSSIKQTNDGGYIVAGYSTSNDGDVPNNYGSEDYWIVKLTSSGNTDWTRSLGGAGGDRATSIYQTNDGGYIVAGSSSSTDGDVSGNHGEADYWVVKLNSSGEKTWTRSLGGSDNDAAYSIQQTRDGGYIVAGSSSSTDGDVSGNHGSRDYWVLKLSPKGD